MPQNVGLVANETERVVMGITATVIQCAAVVNAME